MAESLNHDNEPPETPPIPCDERVSVLLSGMREIVELRKDYDFVLKAEPNPSDNVTTVQPRWKRRTERLRRQNRADDRALIGMIERGIERFVHSANVLADRTVPATTCEAFLEKGSLSVACPRRGADCPMRQRVKLGGLSAQNETPAFADLLARRQPLNIQTEGAVIEMPPNRSTG